MTKNYMINGKETKVFVWNDNWHDEVTVYDNNRSYERTIRKDENGEQFFTWNKQRVYLKDYLSLSMKELRDKIEAVEWITSDDLCLAILHDGVENVRFVCPMHPFTTIVPGLGFGLCDGNHTVDTVCKVVEDYHKVKDGYKIKVVPANEEDLVGSYAYYSSDMASLLKSGHIKILLPGETLKPAVEEKQTFVSKVKEKVNSLFMAKA